MEMEGNESRWGGNSLVGKERECFSVEMEGNSLSGKGKLPNIFKLPTIIFMYLFSYINI